MKNLNYCIDELKKGGYIVEYQNYRGSGIRGSLAGTGLQNKDGRCLLKECRQEFIHLRDKGLLKPVEWKEGPHSGTEWFYNES